MGTPISVGDRFGRLTVSKAVGNRMFECKCDCGGVKNVSGQNLRHTDLKRSVRSCGCLQREYLNSPRSNGLYVGGKKHPMLSTYHGMLTRCGNPKSKSFPAYGGRGITVCDRWSGENGFENFWADMGDRPEGCTLDRIDNDGDYSPGNCQWATKEDQNKNRRKYTLIIVAELNRLRDIEAKYKALTDANN